MANTFYNRIIRKLVVGFGNVFNDITLVRYNPDFTEAERMLVPIEYAPKEVYRNQRNVDNARLLRQLTNDSRHQEMTEQQYRR